MLSGRSIPRKNTMSLNKSQKSGRAIWIILAVYAALLAVFTVVNYDRLIVAFDTESYVVVAKNLLAGNGFADADGLPDGFRTPGYPLFLAAVFLCGGNILAAVIVQLFLAVFSLYLVYRICILMRVKEKYAIACTALFLVDLSLYIYSATAISDAYFYFMLVISTYFLAKYLSAKKFVYFVLFEVMLNYALAVRPILMYYNGLVCLFILALCIFKKAGFKHLAVSVLLFALVFCGWSYRNYCANGVFEMSSVRNHNLTHFDGAVLRSEIEGITISEAREEFDEEFASLYSEKELEGLSQPQVRKLRAEVGNRYIKEHFADYLMQNVKGLFNEMFGTNREFLEGALKIPALVRAVEVLYLCYLCLIYGAYVLSWLFNFKKAGCADLFILTVSGYCAAASASLGYARFRVAFFGLILLGIFVLWKDGDMVERVKSFIANKKSKKVK